ncbi:MULTISPECIES: hypothetical protein [unclassified Spirillospora]|uniref:hypothetical protein n=1 Tax=unclassified Spirillospora TaxID=2642701 RepID=UPI0037170768
MNVVFLALGATRRTAVVAESGRVVAGGGTATVLLDRPSSWEKDPLPDGVVVVELPVLEQSYRPAAVSLLLFRIPRLLFRVCARGPLREWGERLDRAFRRRVARPVDRGLARIYRRDPAVVRTRAVRRAVLAGGSPDLVVVADPQSLTPAAELVAKGPGRRLDVAFYAPAKPDQVARGALPYRPRQAR